MSRPKMTLTKTQPKVVKHSSSINRNLSPPEDLEDGEDDDDGGSDFDQSFTGNSDAGSGSSSLDL